MKIAEITFEGALRQARLHHHEGNLIVAERVHCDMPDAAPERPNLLREIGIVIYMRGKPREVCAWFNQTRGIDPESSIVVGNFAVMAASMGATGEAITAWFSEIALGPEYFDVYFNPARVSVEQGGVDDAITLCERGLHHAPAQADIRTSLGPALRRREKRSGAAHPDYDAHINIGNAYLKRDEFEAAEGIYEWATEWDRHNHTERETSDYGRAGLC